jgi:hypothetical protein
MPAPVEHIAFDDLFVAYNRMRRDLDVKLKPLGLTLTSLQILMAIHTLQTHPQQCTRAAVAARVGITNSTASIMMGGWDAVLDQWHDALPNAARKQFFAAIGAANSVITKADAAVREERYLKSLKRHSTRANVFRTKGRIG